MTTFLTYLGIAAIIYASAFALAVLLMLAIGVYMLRRGQ